MGQSNGTISREIFTPHQNAHRSSYDAASSDDYCMLSPSRDIVSVEHFQNSERCSRKESTHIERHFPEIRRMKSVHVSFGIDGFDDFFLIDLRRKRKLNYKSIEVFFG